MLELPANRPDPFAPPSSPSDTLAAGEHVGLIINIKSRGQWACFSSASSYSNCLLRTGVLDFQGPAHEWASCVPGATVPSPNPPCLIARQAIVAPLGAFGVVFIDYDARRAVAIQDLVPGFGVDATTRGMTAGGTPEFDWIMAHLSKGHLPVLEVDVVRNGQIATHHVPLPAPPLGLRNSLSWMTQLAADALDMAPESLSRMDRRIPLRVPGWTFSHAYPSAPAAAQWLVDHAPRIHSRELALWESWAQGYGFDALARAARAGLLDQSLPSPAPALPARQRM